MSIAQLILPALGFLVSKAPCSECCEVVVRSSQRHIYAGQQETCYDCGNPLNVQRIADDGVRATDLVFERDAEPRSKTHEVVEVSFDRRRFNDSAIAKWLEHYGLEGFKHVQSRLDWSTFRTDKATPEACVVVMLDEGVVGRCLTKVQ